MEKVLYEKKAQSRINYLGNVQFIAELFKLRMVSDTIIHECIRRLLRSTTTDEVSLECVAILFTVAGKYLDKDKAKVSNALHLACSHIHTYLASCCLIVVHDFYVLYKGSRQCVHEEIG